MTLDVIVAMVSVPAFLAALCVALYYLQARNKVEFLRYDAEVALKSAHGANRIQAEDILRLGDERRTAIALHQSTLASLETFRKLAMDQADEFSKDLAAAHNTIGQLTEERDELRRKRNRGAAQKR